MPTIGEFPKLLVSLFSFRGLTTLGKSEESASGSVDPMKAVNGLLGLEYPMSV